MSKKALTKAQRRRLMKFAAAAGGLLGLACHLLPHHYQAACSAVAKAVSIAVGGC